MDEHQHRAIARWERRWIALSGIMLAVFLGLIAYALIAEGGAIVHGGGRLQPASVTSVPLFASPGARQLSSGDYQVAVLARAFAFEPAVVDLPVGAHARFYLTSQDVLHGFMIEGTSVNIELIPGELAYFDYTFDRPGSFAVVCNEYCGINHENMIGAVRVLPEAEYRQRQAAGTLQGQAAPLTPVASTPPAATGSAGAAPAAAAPAVDGVAVYDAKCAACHQQNGEGHPGAFPPLAGHAPALYRADRSYPLQVLLYGLQGRIVVDGQSYNNVMPAWSQLSDAELAAVATAMLEAWGNDAALPADYQPYTAADVAAERAQALTPTQVAEVRAKLGLE